MLFRSMKIVGVTGFHDSSAVLLEDGEIKLFFKEERLVRRKRAFSAKESVNTILQNHKNIDYFAVCDPYLGEDVFYETLSRVSNTSVKDYTSAHHMCHASQAFYNSGFDDALVFVIDRNGSVVNDMMRESETVFEVSYPCNFKTLHKNFWIHDSGSNCDIKVIKEIERFKTDYKFSYKIGRAHV